MATKIHNILLKKETKKKIKSEIVADNNDGIEIVENIKFDSFDSSFGFQFLSCEIFLRHSCHAKKAQKKNQYAWLYTIIQKTDAVCNCINASE